MVTHGGEQLSNPEAARQHLWSRQRGAINITHGGRPEENSSTSGIHLLKVSGSCFQRAAAVVARTGGGQFVDYYVRVMLAMLISPARHSL